jgi:AcrR family transcriptional regulator
MLLESNGFTGFTLDALARESGVTRQTIHNLFGTKAGVLEALFDQIALDSGMEQMSHVMQQADAAEMLDSFVHIFIAFWTRNRLLLRRVHGIAAIDPEFATAVEARNNRRRMAAAKVVEMIDRRSRQREEAKKTAQAATLYALTSFEFFDVLAESCGSVEMAANLLPEIASKALI